MPKVATKWKDASGYTSFAPTNEGFSLLLETGGTILLETSYDLLLEDTVATPKYATSWSTPSKVRSSWADSDGYSTVTRGVSTTRVMESSEERITEEGVTRVTEDSEFNRKPLTEWTE